MKVELNRALRHVERIGDISHRHVIDIVEGESGSLAGRHMSQKRVQLAADLALDIDTGGG